MEVLETRTIYLCAPQGRILGPLLLSVYINSLWTHIVCGWCCFNSCCVERSTSPIFQICELCFIVFFVLERVFWWEWILSDVVNDNVCMLFTVRNCLVYVLYKTCVYLSTSWGSCSLHKSHLARSKSYWKKENTSKTRAVHIIQTCHRWCRREKMVVYFCRLHQNKNPTPLCRLISEISSIIYFNTSASASFPYE